MPFYKGDKGYDGMLRLLKEKGLYIDPTEAIYRVPIEE